MKSIIMKVHKHDGSRRITIPTEIIKARGWENEKYLEFTDFQTGDVRLTPPGQVKKEIIPNENAHGQLSTAKT